MALPGSSAMARSEVLRNRAPTSPSEASSAGVT